MNNHGSSGSPLNWAQFAKALARPKVSEVCEDPEHLFDSYYRIGDAEYVDVSHQWNPEFTEQAVFVLAFFWAPTREIFQRLVTRAVETVSEDHGFTGALPDGLRLSPGCVDFGRITELVAANAHLRSNLVELYDSRTWTRIGCCVSVERITYYFRSSPPVPPGEVPYGAKLVTSDDRWKKCG